ncbi:unnamed protein product [Absidia cylindrospora]
MPHTPVNIDLEKKNDNANLTTEQIANKNKFVASPINCKLFVEKLSPNQPSELRKAEILWARETNGNNNSNDNDNNSNNNRPLRIQQAFG